jgi:hypothetical protein
MVVMEIRDDEMIQERKGNVFVNCERVLVLTLVYVRERVDV